MVNEVNKPPSPENIILGERLAASHRQLQEMQEEHRQLLQEMEMLRQRAAELSRLNAQQDELELLRSKVTTARNQVHPPVPQSANVNTNAETKTETATESVPSAVGATTESEVTHQSQSTETCDTPAKATEPNAEEEAEDPETAEYLQEKLAEISALKARYKRVENMMNTTEMIEKHIASKEASSTGTVRPVATTAQTPTAQPVVDATTAATPSPPTATDSNNNTSPANEELLSTMMNMFTDFTSDLRSQAEDLRAERDRIRALKEDLLRRKGQS